MMALWVLGKTRHKIVPTREGSQSRDYSMENFKNVRQAWCVSWWLGYIRTSWRDFHALLPFTTLFLQNKAKATLHSSRQRRGRTGPKRSSKLWHESALTALKVGRFWELSSTPTHVSFNTFEIEVTYFKTH